MKLYKKTLANLRDRGNAIHINYLMNVLVCLVFSHSVVIVHRITVVKRVKQMIENRKVTANQLNNGCRVKNCAF